MQTMTFEEATDLIDTAAMFLEEVKRSTTDEMALGYLSDSVDEIDNAIHRLNSLQTDNTTSLKVGENVGLKS